MSRRVLVADDSATIQKVIKIAFSRHELEIVEAASYIEALAAVTRNSVDALILDASLPGARGPQDFAKLRADSGDVPVLLLAGTYDSVDESSFRQVGFTQFLKKPFESSDIVAILDGMIGAGDEMSDELTPPPPLGRPQHPTMIVAGGTFDPTRPHPASEGGMPPPPPAIDQTRKGRRAFGEGEDTAPTRAFAGTDEATDPRRGSAPRAPLPAPSAPTSSRPLAEDIASALQAELPTLVRAAVEDYCDRHFKSLARDIIATELRRLADEKARHLVDN